MVHDVITAVDSATGEELCRRWDLDARCGRPQTLYRWDHRRLADPQDYEFRARQSAARLLEALLKDAERAYAAQEAELRKSPARVRAPAGTRNVLLNVT